MQLRRVIQTGLPAASHQPAALWTGRNAILLGLLHRTDIIVRRERRVKELNTEKTIRAGTAGEVDKREGSGIMTAFRWNTDAGGAGNG